MSIDIRLPSITATTDTEKLAQLQSYMYQLVEQLNWALNNGIEMPSVKTSSGETIDASTIKSVVMNSAEIINVYYDAIVRRIGTSYASNSEFQEFKSCTTEDINNISDAIYDIKTRIEGITNEYLRNSDNGVEIGTTDDIFALFTSELITFNKALKATIKNQYASNDIITFATNCPIGVTPFYTDEDINLGSYDIVGSVQKVSNEIIIVNATIISTGVSTINRFYNGEWSGWTQ